MEKEKEIYKLPKGWIWTSIGEIAALSSGGTPSRGNSSYFRGDIPWVKSGELNYNIIIDTEEKITQEAIDSSSAKVVPAKTLLIALYGSTVGKIAILGIEASTNQAVASIMTFSNFNQEFLYYFLFHNREKLLKKRKGGAQPNISQTILSNYALPLPSFMEQNIIVSKIESLFSELDHAEKGLEKEKQQLEVYRQALLKSAFEGELTEQWRKENNPELAEKLLYKIKEERQKQYEQELVDWKNTVSKWEDEGKIDKRPTRPSKPIIPEKPNNSHLNRLWKLPDEWEWTQLGLITFITKLAGFEYTKYVKYEDGGGLFVLKAENASAKGFKKTEFSKIKSERIEHLKRSQLNGGELLIVFVGSGTGNVSVVPKDKKYFLGPNIGMARPYSGINTKFLEYFFQSPFGKRILMVTAKAVAQPSLSMGTIRQSPIAITSIAEQNEIVSRLESKLTVLEDLVKTIASSLTQINAFRHSVLKNAFEGKLVPQDSNHENVLELLKDIKKEKEEYLKAEKARLKLKPKRKMEKKKTVLEILESANNPITAKELWQQSTHHDDIEAFYKELKEIYPKISEVKQNTESLLSLKK